VGTLTGTVTIVLMLASVLAGSGLAGRISGQDKSC
jgi:hypothetical protein